MVKFFLEIDYGKTNTDQKITKKHPRNPKKDVAEDRILCPGRDPDIFLDRFSSHQITG
jgi:hypothetical protein